MAFTTKRSLLAPAAGLAMLASLTACASLEPEPCTPEWVDYQTEQVLRPFVREYRSEINTLRDLSGDLENPGVLTTMRLIGQADTIADMFEDFQGRAVPRIENALAQCSAPGEASDLLVAMLEREGVEPDVINWIEALGVLVEGYQRRNGSTET
ncbi:MAG: hypothetical protein AAFO88_03730 [Pseudomonadota bacterium]